MNIDFIVENVCYLKNRYQTNDPFALCEAIGVSVVFHSMGTQQESCKGFVTRMSGIDIRNTGREEECRYDLRHGVRTAGAKAQASGRTGIEKRTVSK